MPVPNLPIKFLSASRPPRINRKVSPILMKNLVEYTQSKFNELIQADELFREHIRIMQERKLKSVVFGGWARDRIDEIINSRVNFSGDIDMVALGDSSVVDILGKKSTATVFGGAGISESTIYFDAWDLPNTFHIKKYSLSVEFETLPMTADYTFNSIIFKPAQFFERPEIYQIGAISAIEDRIVEFQSDEIILPIIQASRSVNLATKLDFEFSDTLKIFLQDICSKEKALEEVLNGVERYCLKNLVHVAKRKLAEALIFN